MTKLEQTIISRAGDYLDEMESYDKTERVNKAHSFFYLSSLTQLAYLHDSGMSESAVRELIEIDKTASKFIADAKK